MIEKKILHVYEAEDRRAEVQRIKELRQPFRAVFLTKKSSEVQRDGESRYYTHSPRYCHTEREAIEAAKRFAYQR